MPLTLCFYILICIQNLLRTQPHISITLGINRVNDRKVSVAKMDEVNDSIDSDLPLRAP